MQSLAALPVFERPAKTLATATFDWQDPLCLSASLTEDYELDYFYQHPESADVVDGATSYLAARAFDPFEVMV